MTDLPSPAASVARLPAWVWRPTLAFAATRLGIILIAYLGAVWLADSADPPPYHLRGMDNVVLDVLGSRWDTGFYISIAEEGYVHSGVAFPSTPFFPLYPLLIRAARPLVGDAALAGILISHLALWGASLLFYRLVEAGWGADIANRAVWYLLIFPTAFFGSAVYSESLFLLTTIGALYAARRERWWLAAGLGGAASLTRLVGVVVAPMLALEWLTQHRDKARPWYGQAGLWASGLSLWGVAAYMAYLWQRFDDPLGFMTASQAWQRAPQMPGLTIGALLRRPAEGWGAAWLAGRVPLGDWLDLSLVLLFLGLGLVLLYQHAWSEGVFVWLGVMIPFSSGLLLSQRRYMWVLFPAFILLARWGQRPGVDRFITTLSLMLLALLTALFANGYWVG